MPIRPSEFDDTAHWLKPILESAPSILVAISGPIGAGKSTLARFLAWYFNVSLIESDYYLSRHMVGFECETAEIDRIIKQRRAIRRPIIVEGAAILPALAKIGCVPDGIIQVWNRSDDRQPSAEELSALNPSIWGFSKCPTNKVVVHHN